MSLSKKFRIQNGVSISGTVEVGGNLVIDSDGSVTTNELSVNGNSVVTGSLTSSKKTNITATSTTVETGTHLYVSAAGQTITLPVSPSIGDSAHITVGDFADTVISRNGSNIMGLAEDFTMDAACLSINFTFTDTSKGWAMS